MWLDTDVVRSLKRGVNIVDDVVFQVTLLSFPPSIRLRCVVFPLNQHLRPGHRETISSALRLRPLRRAAKSLLHHVPDRYPISYWFRLPISLAVTVKLRTAVSET